MIKGHKKKLQQFTSEDRGRVRIGLDCLRSQSDLNPYLTQIDIFLLSPTHT